MIPKILVTRRIHEGGLKLLEKLCEVEVWAKDNPPSQDELVKLVSGKDGVLCLLTDRIDGKVMGAADRLKVISSYSVGYDHIDVEEATKRGVYVTYTPGVLTEATADFTWALLMAAARRVVEADRYVRGGVWKVAWSPDLLLGVDLRGKVLGIVGLGRIGSAVARRALGFDMKILYYKPKRASQRVERRLKANYVDLETLLRESDFVTLHVPLSRETYHMIDEEKLRLMKPTAYLINTSRGGVVDQGALVHALKEKWIGGAALDVFESEPLSPNDPLANMPNVVLAPHIASATHEARASMARLAAENLLAVLKGIRPPCLVNPEVQAVKPLSEVKML